MYSDGMERVNTLTDIKNIHSSKIVMQLTFCIPSIASKLRRPGTKCKECH